MYLKYFPTGLVDVVCSLILLMMTMRIQAIGADLFRNGPKENNKR